VSIFTFTPQYEKDAFGHHGDHVDALDLARDDEGRGLVVRIGGAGANGGDEAVVGVDDLAVPVRAPVEEGHQLAALRLGLLDDHQRIDTDQFAVFIGVAVTRARPARRDVAHDGAGIAADLVAFARWTSHCRAPSPGCREHLVRRGWQVAHTRTRGIANGVEDGRRGGDQHMLAQTLRAIGPCGSGTSTMIDFTSGMSPKVGIR
jgi:hypothetical protein